jgi:hypothetical protein
MEYMSLMLHCKPESPEFIDEIDERLNAQAELGWKLKQIVQVRANNFLLVFEK